ncbi:cell division protein FtsL [Paenibacillus glycinis]|uniref:Cell division protein FtsL n=1 Tax=Paenibacillus glycinis TaxID=2697035 RepID=A0ABW9XJK6_9BACL|nr:cell division protein FtsL [Paenibacillus glycinis]NBD22804.1 cell division protein FtsL [Paenibacillus glycinis]
MAYVNGNLALQPKRKPEQKPSFRETKKVVIKRKPIPVQEKLLYLFTILACVVVAGAIIFRYAQIYQMEKEIATLTTNQAKLEEQIAHLTSQKEVANDPATIKSKAETMLGMNLPEEKEDDPIEVNVPTKAPAANSESSLANKD